MSKLHDNILTIKVIRSFEHRNVRYLVLKNVALTEWNTQKLLEECRKQLASSALPPAFRNFEFDALKIEHFPHGSKSNNPIINVNNEELFLKPDQLLSEAGVVNETEIALFRMQDFQDYCRAN